MFWHSHYLPFRFHRLLFILRTSISLSFLFPIFFLFSLKETLLFRLIVPLLHSFNSKTSWQESRNELKWYFFQWQSKKLFFVPERDRVVISLLHIALLPLLFHFFSFISYLSFLLFHFFSFISSLSFGHHSFKSFHFPVHQLSFGLWLKSKSKKNHQNSFLKLWKM